MGSTVGGQGIPCILQGSCSWCNTRTWGILHFLDHRATVQKNTHNVITRWKLWFKQWAITYSSLKKKTGCVMLGQMPQLIWWLHGETEVLSVIPCSAGYVCCSNKYEGKTLSDVNGNHWTVPTHTHQIWVSQTLLSKQHQQLNTEFVENMMVQEQLNLSTHLTQEQLRFIHAVYFSIWTNTPDFHMLHLTITEVFCVHLTILYLLWYPSLKESKFLT